MQTFLQHLIAGLIVMAFIGVFLIVNLYFYNQRYLKVHPCSWFQTQTQAQKAFERNPSKWHDLDRNKDGIACTSLALNPTI